MQNETTGEEESNEVLYFGDPLMLTFSRPTGSRNWIRNLGFGTPSTNGDISKWNYDSQFPSNSVIDQRSGYEHLNRLGVTNASQVEVNFFFYVELSIIPNF